ncbi:hypothetical protein Gohar_013609, partial [Gossypium harknessii]|nr:hypothetical protein [Gossypium harknessii]
MNPTIRYSRRSSRPTQVEQCVLAELEEGEKDQSFAIVANYHRQVDYDESSDDDMIFLLSALH